MSSGFGSLGQMISLPWAVHLHSQDRKYTLPCASPTASCRVELGPSQGSRQLTAPSHRNKPSCNGYKNKGDEGRKPRTSLLTNFSLMLMQYLLINIFSHIYLEQVSSTLLQEGWKKTILMFYTFWSQIYSHDHLSALPACKKTHMHTHTYQLHTGSLPQLNILVLWSCHQQLRKHVEGRDRARVNLREKGEACGEFSVGPPQSRKHLMSQTQRFFPYICDPSNSPFYAATSLEVCLLAGYTHHYL